MRKQNVILSSLTGMYLIASVPTTSLANDVYVDLSVLSALRGNEEFVTDNAPLFPDVKKAPKPIKKQIKAENKKVVANKPKANVQSKPKNEQKPVAQQELAPVKKIEPKEIPDIVKTSEPDLSTESAQVATQPVEKDTFVEVKKQIENIQSLPVVEEKVAIPEKNIIVPQTIEPTNSQPEPEPLEAPKKQVNVAPIAMADSKQLVFADGVDELTNEHKHQIDKIIATFNNPTENMIAINSFNYDDGTDIFNKKRLSLRRIVAVRSYLLSKGYKNFMPKVINLTDDASKTNVVELEEVK